MSQPSEQEIKARIDQLAQTMRQRGLAFSDMQARERARDIVMQEIKMQTAFEEKKDDLAMNPQQSRPRMSAETLRSAGGMLTGDELPKNVPLAELLKGRNAQQKKDEE